MSGLNNADTVCFIKCCLCIGLGRIGETLITPHCAPGIPYDEAVLGVTHYGYAVPSAYCARLVNVKVSFGVRSVVPGSVYPQSG